MLPSKCTILKCSRLELCLLSCHVAMQYISGQRTLPARLQSVVGLSPPPGQLLFKKYNILIFVLTNPVTYT